MYYFISDTHLGQGEDTLSREKKLVKWLHEIAPSAKAIFFVGDVFDFWYEYKRVVPRGFTRFLGALSELSDRGVDLHFFVGNHDQWMRDYLAKECGVKLHFRGEIKELYGKKVYIAHGDNEPTKKPCLVKFMNSCFRSRVIKWIFSTFFHPNSALAFGKRWSSGSRKNKGIAHVFRGEDEPLVAYARDMKDADYAVFGHIHCAEDYPLGENRKVVFLGEWFEQYTFASLDSEGNLELEKL
ncbi:MAG: UDP-2,3-diacylglucosamine diphosphatase [Rikenellaceae bacterium]